MEVPEVGALDSTIIELPNTVQLGYASRPSADTWRPDAQLLEGILEGTTGRYVDELLDIIRGDDYSHFNIAKADEAFDQVRTKCMAKGMPFREHRCKIDCVSSVTHFDGCFVDSTGRTYYGEMSGALHGTEAVTGGRGTAYKWKHPVGVFQLTRTRGLTALGAPDTPCAFISATDTLRVIQRQQLWDTSRNPWYPDAKAPSRPADYAPPIGEVQAYCSYPRTVNRIYNYRFGYSTDLQALHEDRHDSSDYAPERFPAVHLYLNRQGRKGRHIVNVSTSGTVILGATTIGDVLDTAQCIYYAVYPHLRAPVDDAWHARRSNSRKSYASPSIRTQYNY